MKSLILLVFSVFIFFHPIAGQSFNGIKNLISTEVSEANDIVSDQSNNFYITGGFQGTIDCDPGDGVFNMTSLGYFDVLICKYDPEGNFLWAKTLGDEDDDRGYGIALDSEDNVFVFGYFQGTPDFDPGNGVHNMTATGSNDLFILKLDKDGNFIWAKQIQGIINFEGAGLDREAPISVDKSGNIYLCGNFYQADFDPGAGTFTMTRIGYSDAYLLKLDNDGNFVWAKQFGGSNITNARSVVNDKNNNVYVSGIFSGETDFDPNSGTANLTAASSVEGFIVKLTKEGEYEWARATGGSAEGFVVDTLNNVYISGSFGNTVDTDPGAGTTNFTAKVSDIFLTKLDAAGNFVWSRQLRGTTNSSGSYMRDIGIDNNFNIYLLGYHWGDIDVDPSPTVTIISDGPYVLTKLDSSGSFLGGEIKTSWGYGKLSIVDSSQYYATGSTGYIFIFGKSDLVSSTINKQSFIDFSLYPNPASNEISINHSQLQQITQVRIYNSFGRLIREYSDIKDTEKLIISDLHDGIYFIQLQSGEAISEPRKLIIKN